MVHLLTHAVHPPHSSLASLKDTGTEPFFTLADHTTSHRHTQTQHTNSHTWRWDCALIVGVRASVPSTPWTRGWHHSVLGIINGGKHFQGNSGPHSFRSPWGKDCDGSLISSQLCKTVQRLTDIWHIYNMCMSACTRVRVCLRVSSSCNSSNNSAVFPVLINCRPSIWVVHVPFLQQHCRPAFEEFHLNLPFEMFSIQTKASEKHVYRFK